MIKILAVDDEKNVRLLLEEELGELGYDVQTCDGQSEIIPIIEDLKPHAVIMDIRLCRMDGRDGLDLLQTIRNKYYDLPVIIYTAFPTYRHDDRTMSATCYIEKSFDMKELIEKIEMALISDGLEFSRLSFGASIAERDISIGLFDYFLSTHSYNRVFSGEKTAIIGNRGMGKSAIIRMISKRQKRQDNIVIEFLSRDYSYEIFNEVMVPKDRSSWAKQSAYAAAWKYLIIVQVMKQLNKAGSMFKSGDSAKIYSYLRDKQLDAEHNPIALLISYLKRIEKIKIGKYEAGIKTSKLQKLYKLEEINNLIPSISNLCMKKRVFVLIDDLDSGWDASEDAQAFIAGLFQAATLINQINPNLRVLLSIRKEIFENIPSLYADAEKYRDEIEMLSWDESALFRLITKRIKYSVPGLIKASDNEAWNSAFKDRCVNDRLELFNYIIDRTLCRPRELIQFCSKALQIAQENSRWPIDLFSIKKAEFEFSKERSFDLSSEYRFQYPGLWSLFEAFRGTKPELSYDELINTCRSISRGELKLDESTRWVIDQQPEKLINVLWEVGFLQAKATEDILGPNEEKKGYIGSYQVPHLTLNNTKSFRIHPMFMKYLNI